MRVAAIHSRFILIHNLTLPLAVDVQEETGLSWANEPAPPGNMAEAPARRVTRSVSRASSASSDGVAGAAAGDATATSGAADCNLRLFLALTGALAQGTRRASVA